MSTAADYAGRVFDLAMIHGMTESRAVRVDQSLFGNSGEVCTGIQKLAQRWLLEFMTERQSMGFHLADRGSDFMRWLRRGNIRIEYDVRVYFNFAAQQVKTNLTSDETPTTPMDERLKQASLQSFTIGEGQLTLAINVISMAEDSRQIILPVSVLPTTLTLPE